MKLPPKVYYDFKRDVLCVVTKSQGHMTCVSKRNPKKNIIREWVIYYVQESESDHNGWTRISSDLDFSELIEIGEL